MEIALAALSVMYQGTPACGSGAGGQGLGLGLVLISCGSSSHLKSISCSGVSVK